MSNVDKPTPVASQSKSGCATCLTIAIAVPVVLGLMVWTMVRKQRHFEEQQRVHRLQEEFNAAKKSWGIATIKDSELLAMLANDADCVKNVTYLFFDMVKITPEAAPSVARLANVRTIVFYDADGADEVLKHAQGLPIKQLDWAGR